MNNIIKYIIQTSMWCIVALFARPENFFQAFMAESGVTEEQTVFLVTLMQLTQTAFILIFSPRADRIKNVKKITAFSLVLCIPMLFFLIVNCFSNNLTSNFSFATLVVLALISQLGIGFFYMFMMKLVYHIMDINQYGIVQSRSGAIGNIVSFTVSLVFSFALSRFKYFSVMGWAYFATIVSILVFFLATVTMKECRAERKEATEKINIFTYPPFYRLAVPNIIRGFCSGAMVMMVTIGYYYDILDSSSASALVVISTVACVTGYISYPLFDKLLGLRKIMIAFPAISLFTMPAMLIFNNTAAFMIFYGISYISTALMDLCFPIAVTKLIDYKVAGAYNGYRNMLHTLGISLFSGLCLVLLNTIGGTLTLLIAAVMQLIAGAVYCYYLKKASSE